MEILSSTFLPYNPHTLFHSPSLTLQILLTNANPEDFRLNEHRVKIQPTMQQGYVVCICRLHHQLHSRTQFPPAYYYIRSYVISRSNIYTVAFNARLQIFQLEAAVAAVYLTTTTI